jgi:hypothetical protein
MSVRSISSVEPWSEPWKNLTDGQVRTMVLDRTTAALATWMRSQEDELQPIYTTTLTLAAIDPVHQEKALGYIVCYRQA